jgi:hypothetical protein
VARTLTIPTTLVMPRMHSFAELSGLIGNRDAIDDRLGGILGRLATVGDIGEWIASKVFDIELPAAANNTAFDGYFTTGALSGTTVNIKTYMQQDFTLDVTDSDALDYYLVFTGPKSKLGSSRGTLRPFRIESVYLFKSEDLLAVAPESSGLRGARSCMSWMRMKHNNSQNALDTVRLRMDRNRSRRPPPRGRLRL